MQTLADIDNLYKESYSSTHALVFGEPGSGRAMLCRYVSGGYSSKHINWTKYMWGLCNGVPVNVTGGIKIYNLDCLRYNYYSITNFTNYLDKIILRRGELKRAFIVLKHGVLSRERAEFYEMCKKELRARSVPVTVVHTFCESGEKMAGDYVPCCFVDLRTVDSKLLLETAARVKASVDQLRALM
jgi:hypothetical protein